MSLTESANPFAFFKKAHCCTSVHCCYWPSEAIVNVSHKQPASGGLLCYAAFWSAFLRRCPCDWSYNCLCFLLHKCESPFLRHSFVYFLCKIKMEDDHFVNFLSALLSCTVFVQINPSRILYINAPGAWEVSWQFSNRCMRSPFDFYLLR